MPNINATISLRGRWGGGGKTAEGSTFCVIIVTNVSFLSRPWSKAKIEWRSHGRQGGRVEDHKPELDTTSTGTPEAAAATSGESGADAPEAAPLSPREMDQYECRACGYTYEPAKGDDRAGISSGVDFSDLPDQWRCPVCGAPKKQFSNIGPAGSPSGFKENLGYGLGVNTLTPGQKNILIFGSLALAVLFFLSLYGLR